MNNKIIMYKTSYVLEIGQYTEETIIVEQICNRTGIKFGVSAWFFDE